MLNGQVAPARLDDMVRRILTARIAEGQLDGDQAGSHDAVVTTTAHQDFARQLAAQGTVLMKNDHGVLPIGRRARSVAVIGAAANEHPIYTGGGSANVVPSRTITPLDGITARAGGAVDVTYAAGTAGTQPRRPAS